jgi:hypothetical protein
MPTKEIAPLESEKGEDNDAERIQRKQDAIAQLRAFFASEQMDSKRRRVEFTEKCGTTWAHMQQCMRGKRLIAPWLAVNLDRESGGALDMTTLCVEAASNYRIDWNYIRTEMRKNPRG